jgi:Flp pilus assembly protein TadB
MVHITLGTALLMGTALLCMAGLALMALRFTRRARLRRQREALQDAGLRLAFDACAPEGGDLSLEPFRISRLRADGIDGHERRRD